jgi:hypothetical protein
MAKKEGHEKGVGPYAGNDVKLTRIGQKFSMGRDISKLVEPSAKRDNGFSAALDNPSDE